MPLASNICFLFYCLNYILQKKTIMQHLKAKTPLKTPFNEQNSPKLAKISKKQ